MGRSRHFPGQKAARALEIPIFTVIDCCCLENPSRLSYLGTLGARYQTGLSMILRPSYCDYATVIVADRSTFSTGDHFPFL